MVEAERGTRSPSPVRRPWPSPCSHLTLANRLSWNAPASTDSGLVTASTLVHIDAGAMNLTLR